jgi:hypothetical protein
MHLKLINFISQKAEMQREIHYIHFVLFKDYKMENIVCYTPSKVTCIKTQAPIFSLC